MAWAESPGLRGGSFYLRDRGNSGSRVEPAPAVEGSAIPRLTPSLSDLARLFLSL